PADARRDGTGRARGQERTATEEHQEGKNDQKARTGAEAAGFVSDERRRCHPNRCDRGGNSGSHHQRIRPRFESLPQRGAVRLSRHPGAACAEERRQTGQKEEAEQCEQPCRNRFAHDGAIIAPQRHRSEGVLSEHDTQERAGHCNICCSQKNSHSDLSPAPLGTTLHRRRSRGVRKAISAAAHQRAGISSQTTCLSIDSANSLIAVPRRISHRPAGFTSAWEFTWRTFSTCRVETFSTPVFANGRASAECRRGTQSACATLFLQATFSRNRSFRLEPVVVWLSFWGEVRVSACECRGAPPFALHGEG